MHAICAGCIAQATVCSLCVCYSNVCVTGNLILLTCALSLHLLLCLSFSVGLWNCQSAVNKADFISAFSLQSTLSILGLTETWIRPEDSATAAALSHNFSFSHTPRQFGQGGGTGLLISNNWKYSTHSPLGNHNSFESHAITVTAPIQLQIVVFYRPPGPLDGATISLTGYFQT